MDPMDGSRRWISDLASPAEIRSFSTRWGAPVADHPLLSLPTPLDAIEHAGSGMAI
jgi:hypothetical protein